MSMIPRTDAEIRQRAADLHSKVSSLAQQVTTIEDELEKIGRMRYDHPDYPGLNHERKLQADINQLEEDKFWMETTLEALEWALGETDVKAEEVSEEEWKQRTI